MPDTYASVLIANMCVTTVLQHVGPNGIVQTHFRFTRNMWTYRRFKHKVTFKDGQGVFTKVNSNYSDYVRD